MTTAEAKRALMAYRPGSRDQDDPEIAAALARAEEDPELHAWLEEHIAFQRMVRDELRRASVPANLKDRILAQSKIVRPIWTRPAFLLAAACLAAGLILVGVMFRPAREVESFDTYRSRMVGFALRLYEMEIVTKNPEQIRQHLRSRGAPADYSFPPGLQGTPVKGGARLTWQGRPVSMVCFNWQTNKTLFMFVIDARAIPDADRIGEDVRLTPAHGITTVSWRRNGKIYLLAADTEAETLRKLLTRGAAKLGRSEFARITALPYSPLIERSRNGTQLRTRGAPEVGQLRLPVQNPGWKPKPS